MTALLFGGVAGNPLVYETALLLQALTAVMVFAVCAVQHSGREAPGDAGVAGSRNKPKPS